MSDVAVVLAADRTRTLERLEHLRSSFAEIVTASRDSNADDEHDPEGSTIAFERSQVTALVRQAEEHLAEIEAAMRRLEEGSYGRCEICGGSVSSARLEVRPTARRCIACAGRA